MKISIIIPSNNDAAYVEQLIQHIQHFSNPDNIEEVIIIESFQCDKILQIAEKKHAKLYYNQFADRTAQMEIGAFEAKGEVIYFIQPGCTPPADFDVRILKYVKQRYEMGCFDFEYSTSDTWFTRWVKIMRAFLHKDIKLPESFYVLNHLFYESGGFLANTNYLILKKKVIALGKQVYH